MPEKTSTRRLSKGQIALMMVIDALALAIAVSLFLWMEPRDAEAAVLAFVAPLVFAGFFNLVIVLVSLKP